MMIRILLLLILINTTAYADQHIRSYYEDHFDVAGYVGYQHVWGTLDTDPIHSSPEVGLIINYHIDDNWSIFTQFKLEDDYIEQSLAYSFITYTKMVGNVPITISGGKIRRQYGLYNKDRLNPRTRPGNVAPQAMYWDLLRFASTTGYGLSISAHIDNLSIKYTVDKPIVVNEAEESLVWFDRRQTTMDPRFGGRHSINVDYHKGEWTLASTIIFSDWGHGAEGKNVAFTLGGERHWDHWTVSLEGMGIFEYHNHAAAISATVQYDFHENLTIHTNFNKYHTFYKEESSFQDKYFTTSNDFSVGLSLHADNWELRTEVHAAQGSAWIDTHSSTNPEYDDIWYYGATSLVYYF